MEFLTDLLSADDIEVNQLEFSTEGGIQELLPDPFVSQEITTSYLVKWT